MFCAHTLANEAQNDEISFEVGCSQEVKQSLVQRTDDFSETTQISELIVSLTTTEEVQIGSDSTENKDDATRDSSVCTCIVDGHLESCSKRDVEMMSSTLSSNSIMPLTSIASAIQSSVYPPIENSELGAGTTS